MSIQKLYQETIKQHNQAPIGYAASFKATHQSEGVNPSCGDEITLKIQLHPQHLIIEKMGFIGDCCAICKAACSILSQHVIAQPVAAVVRDFQNIQQSFYQKESITLDSFECFSAVNQFPSRVNCALLPWHTLIKMISPATQIKASY
ncbi:Fe-S cluster assembly sulfur transfer protein SufU [Aliikangiella sp. IMCC44632]